MVINQLITFHKPNIKVKSDKIIDYLVPQIKWAVRFLVDACWDMWMRGKLHSRILAAYIEALERRARPTSVVRWCFPDFDNISMFMFRSAVLLVRMRIRDTMDWMMPILRNKEFSFWCSTSSRQSPWWWFWDWIGIPRELGIYGLFFLKNLKFMFESIGPNIFSIIINITHIICLFPKEVGADPKH